MTRPPFSAALIALAMVAAATACTSSARPWLVATDSGQLRPTLQWVLLDESTQRALAPRKLSNLCYDLQVYSAADGMLVSELFALPGTGTRLTEPLPASGAYHWAVRPRFDTEFGTRVGAWHGVMGVPPTKLASMARFTVE